MTNETHLCFVSDTLHSYLDSGIEFGVGGAERQQYLLGKEFLERNWPVSIITLDTGRHGSSVNIDGFDVWEQIPDTRGVLSAPRKTLSVVQALRTVDADVYYVRGNDFLAIVTALYCRFSESKFVYAIANDSNVEAEHLQYKGLPLRKLYLWAIGNADAVTVLTPYQQQVLEQNHGVTSSVVPCGYDLPPSEKVTAHDDREYVLWVGRLDREQKRPERFLELARTLPEIPFVMIGPPDNDDREREYFDYIKEESSTIDNLEFIEYVPPDQIHDYYQRASVLVSTSDYEGFGNVLLEAWRYATPVVTSNYTLHGVIENRNVGVKAESPERLSNIVSHLHVDDEKRAEMGKSGRELVRQRYSMQSIADKYNEIFVNL